MERVDGVRMIELIDLCMNCLHGFAKSIENRAIVRDPGIVMMLKSRLLLNNPSENVQRLACAVLSELAGDADGCYVIHMSGSCQDIENIITKHEKDSTKQKIGKCHTWQKNTIMAIIIVGSFCSSICLFNHGWSAENPARFGL
jgi:hypothetical protein